MSAMKTYFPQELAQFIRPEDNDGFDALAPGPAPEHVVIHCQGGHPPVTLPSATVRYRKPLRTKCGHCIRDGGLSLAESHPDVAAEWAEGTTPGFTPYNVSPNSSIILGFRCPTHGVYFAKVTHRTYNGSGCPDCGRDRTSAANSTTPAIDGYPQLVAAFLPRNGIDPGEVRMGVLKSFWWKCSECNKPCQRSPRNFLDSGLKCRPCVNSSSGMYAASRVKNLLKVKYPSYAGELLDELNGQFAADTVGAGSKKLLWWQCADCGTKFQKSPNLRTGNNRQPERAVRVSPHFYPSGRCSRCRCIPEG